jgi:hypothetical protein
MGFARWIRETIKWRTARRRLKISVGVAGPSASKLADVICEMADNLNKVVTEEEIQAVSAVLKARLKPITYPEPHTVRLKPCMISWEAAEAARNRPHDRAQAEDISGWTPTPDKLSINGTKRLSVSQPTSVRIRIGSKS